MERVMIIGAGGVGRVVFRKCVQHPEIFNEILFASRTVSKCEAIASEISSPQSKITTAPVDADNVDELSALIERHKPQLVINVALPYEDLTIMRACLKTGTHYLDTANYEHPDEARFCYAPQWEMNDEFQKAGLTALLGCGFDPGKCPDEAQGHFGLAGIRERAISLDGTFEIISTPGAGTCATIRIKPPPRVAGGENGDAK